MHSTRPCILAIIPIALVLLTPGCMMLGGLPPNTKTSESTVDYSNGYLKYGTHYTFEPYNAAGTNQLH